MSVVVKKMVYSALAYRWCVCMNYILKVCVLNTKKTPLGRFRKYYALWRLIASLISSSDAFDGNSGSK